VFLLVGDTLGCDRLSIVAPNCDDRAAFYYVLGGQYTLRCDEKARAAADHTAARNRRGLAFQGFLNIFDTCPLGLRVLRRVSEARRHQKYRAPAEACQPRLKVSHQI
jgi:hypothetical protein